VKRILPLLLLCAAAHADETITFDAVGDVMLGSAYPDDTKLPPNDGKDLLAPVAAILGAADVAFGNLEGPLADDGASSKCGPHPKPKSCYAFRVPTRYGQYLKDAGFDVFSLANNHALDMGPPGRESTKKVLDGLGIAHSGEVGDVAHLTVRGVRVAVIAFATYESSYDLLDLDAARAAVAAAKKDADVVVVSFHGGAEGPKYQHVPDGMETYFDEPRGDLRKFTHAMIDAGASLVVGSGPHVVRGMELYAGHLIAYSLGNFATWQSMNLEGPSGLSMILEVRLGADGSFRGATIHPVKQLFPGGPLPDDAKQIIPIVRDLTTADFPKTGVKIADDGTVTAP
jgi:poly-gamma-glutamate capsule biosynthesis protein CapA/YwtB (metallophosphatase superfamily)